MFNRFDTIAAYEKQTDGHTDIQTDGHLSRLRSPRLCNLIKRNSASGVTNQLGVRLQIITR